METQPSAGIAATTVQRKPSQTSGGDPSEFRRVLGEAIDESSPLTQHQRVHAVGASPPSDQPTAPQASQTTQPTGAAIAIYAQQANQAQEAPKLSGWEKYKDDQLLRNSGGKHYYLEEKTVASNPKDQETFSGRIAKDFSDVFGNIKSFFKNLFMGTKILYRDKNNEIREGTQRGFFRACGDFVKNFASALTFGLYHPGRDKAPQGLIERIGFAASKVKEAFADDLVGGTAGSLNHMGKNLVLAGWNLVEVLPDATLGNFDKGKKLTTSIFDNGQVFVEYLTDVIPSGDAWLRVHASDLQKLEAPIIYNLKMPEQYSEDARWRYVRNTPFRKSIETVGALLADVAALALIGQTGLSTKQNNPPP